MVFFDDDRLLDRALALRAWGRSSEKWMFGTRAGDSDGRFLEELDGVEYDGLFIFEENAYGFIPNECGAAFGKSASRAAISSSVKTPWMCR